MDLVLGRERARTNCARRANRRHITLIRRPDPVELAGPEQLGQGAGVEAFSLGSGLTDAGVVGETTITLAT